MQDHVNSPVRPVPVEGLTPRPVRIWRTTSHDTHEPVARETPIAMEFNGVSHAVMLATPCDLEDFATGFALTEGIVDESGQIHDIEVSRADQGITVHIGIASSCFVRLKDRRRQLSGRSGCGLCGIDSLEQVMGQACVVPLPDVRVSPRAVLRAMAGLRDHQPLMAATGATHAAAWAGVDGDVRLVREDIGRHNALDKLIGARIRAARVQPARPGFALITSRASYELVQKAATAGIGLLAAISGPTTLAIERAQTCHITLAGYARGEGMAIYHDAGHIDWPQD